MWVTIEPVTEANIRDYLPEPTVMQLRFIDESMPALGFKFGPTPLAVVGFIPMALLSSVAYAWMETLPGAEEHKLAVGRVGRLTLPEIRKRYTHIIGHCIPAHGSLTWLASLGATFSPGPNGSTRFDIGAAS